MPIDRRRSTVHGLVPHARPAGDPRGDPQDLRALRRRLLAGARHATAASRTISIGAVADGGWLGIAMPEAYGGVRARHHGSRRHDAGGRRIGRGLLRRLGRAHEHLRAQPGRGVRHRGAEAPLPAAADRRRGEGLLRRHRARRRPRHHRAQDPGRARTATAMRSTGRRSGSPPRRWPTACCCSPAPRRSRR